MIEGVLENWLWEEMILRGDELDELVCDDILQVTRVDDLPATYLHVAVGDSLVSILGKWTTFDV